MRKEPLIQPKNLRKFFFGSLVALPVSVLLGLLVWTAFVWIQGFYLWESHYSKVSEIGMNFTDCHCRNFANTRTALDARFACMREKKEAFKDLESLAHSVTIDVANVASNMCGLPEDILQIGAERGDAGWAYQLGLLLIISANDAETTEARLQTQSRAKRWLKFAAHRGGKQQGYMKAFPPYYEGYSRVIRYEIGGREPSERLRRLTELTKLGDPAARFELAFLVKNGLHKPDALEETVDLGVTFESELGVKVSPPSIEITVDGEGFDRMLQAAGLSNDREKSLKLATSKIASILMQQSQRRDRFTVFYPDFESIQQSKLKDFQRCATVANNPALEGQAADCYTAALANLNAEELTQEIYFLPRLIVAKSKVPPRL